MAFTMYMAHWCSIMFLCLTANGEFPRQAPPDEALRFSREAPPDGALRFSRRAPPDGAMRFPRESLPRKSPWQVQPDNDKGPLPYHPDWVYSSGTYSTSNPSSTSTPVSRTTPTASHYRTDIIITALLKEPRLKEPRLKEPDCQVVVYNGYLKVGTDRIKTYCSLIG